MGEKLLLLLLAALPLMGSPGPATLSVAALGSTYGLRASLGYYAGIVAGTATVLLVIASGVAGLLLALPGAAPVVAFLASAYIVYLAWKIAAAPPLTTTGQAGKPPAFAGGYLLAIANPKAYAAIGAVYSGHVLVETNIGADTAAKLALLFAVIVAVNGAWLVFGAAFARYLAAPRLARAINVGFALLLVASVAAALLP